MRLCFSGVHWDRAAPMLGIFPLWGNNQTASDTESVRSSPATKDVLVGVEKGWWGGGEGLAGKGRRKAEVEGGESG